jgi:hypothetical protein
MRGQPKAVNWKVKLKKKITLTKEEKPKEWVPNFKKKIHHKLSLKDEIESY